MIGVAIVRIEKNEEVITHEIIAIAKNEEAAQRFISTKKAEDEEAGKEYSYKTQKYRGIAPSQVNEGCDLHAYNIGK